MDKLGMITKRRKYLSEQEIEMRKRAANGERFTFMVIALVSAMMIPSIYLQVTR